MSPTRRSVISNRRGKRIIEFHKFHGHRLKLEYPGKLLLREMIKSAAKRFNAMRSRRERKRKRTVAPFQKILQKLEKNQADRSIEKTRTRPSPENVPERRRVSVQAPWPVPPRTPRTRWRWCTRAGRRGRA